jgi:hypothetical protein
VGARRLAAFVLLAASARVSAHAQTVQEGRRETSANRQARIERITRDTYTHRWEVAGGGGYLRFRSGQFLQNNNEVTFWMNGTYFFSPSLGVTGEIRGDYGNAKVGNTIYNIPNPQISEYPYMAGPTYRFYRKIKTSASVFALGGAAIGKFDSGSKGVSAAELGLWPDANARPAFAAGVNVDYNLFPNLAFRVTPTFLGTTFGGTLEHNLGVETGLVYRFGRQKK